MNEEYVIEVKDITKNFKIYLDKRNTLKDRLVIKGDRGLEKREVLKGISFNVKKGEAIGLIGKNGCGKSTTLKLLTRIMYPDNGYIKIQGKVSSLLELGAGFHPDMTGRENIYLNASILGLTKKEISSKVDEIISFSELGEFIENPVRTYSSGMYMRLAFSVAINVDAEILLIDEILGVGDVSFQKKCFEKLQEIKRSGTTIVIVSHSLEQIERICDRSIWIFEGRIREEGKPRIVNAHYYQYMENERLQEIENAHVQKFKIAKKSLKNETKNKEAENSKTDKTQNSEIIEIEKRECVECKQIDGGKENPVFCGEAAIRSGNRRVEFVDLKILDSNNNETIVFEKNSAIKIIFTLKSRANIESVSISASIWSNDDVACCGVNTYWEKENMIKVNGIKKVSLTFNNIKLYGGKYWLDIGIYTKDYDECDVIKKVRTFYVHSDCQEREFGIYNMEHVWEI